MARSHNRRSHAGADKLWQCAPTNATTNSLDSLEGLPDFPCLARRSVRPKTTQSTPALPLGLITYCLLLAVAVLIVYYWPEDRQERRRVDGLLQYATKAEKLAEQGDYRTAIIQYNVFLTVAAKCESHSRRLESAVEKAELERERLQLLFDAQSAGQRAPVVEQGVPPSATGAPTAGYSQGR